MVQLAVPLEAGKVYHIYTHANGNENLFRADENYFYFLKKYTQHIYPVAETFAYCLMPNHLHLMVRVRDKEELFRLSKAEGALKLDSSELDMHLQRFVSQQFSNLFNAYTKAYNKKYYRKGSLFVPNFHRKQVVAKAYYVKLISYIHLNPVHHGFVDDVNDWLHSSWHTYISSRPTKLARDEAQMWFNDRTAFEELHRQFKRKDIWIEFSI